MSPFYADDSATVYAGDCLDVLRELPDASVDSVVTDPPYGLEFMGREWDSFTDSAAKFRKPSVADDADGYRVPRGSLPDKYVAGTGYQTWCEQWAIECLRVLKPGGHILAFGGSRTWHRLAAAIEDAGFEIRDSIAWLYGSGFPKSLDVSKAIDKAAGAEREVVGVGNTFALKPGPSTFSGEYLTDRETAAITAPATPDAERWQGWGTALKPAFEPIVVGRKPLAGTVAANVLAHGVGALNIDACRVGTSGGTAKGNPPKGDSTGIYGDGINGACDILDIGAGRWPTNVVLDGSQAAELDRQSGTLTSGANPTRRGSDKFRDAYGDFAGQEECVPARGADSGGASRFFPTFHYEPKAPTHERPREGDVAHPTVKPLDLMRWLVKLVTPPGGVVLDPFAGSGTTAEACVIEHFRCITIEREADYLPLIVARLTKPIQVGLDFEGLGA